MKAAAIDLGTNTFHLIIAEKIHSSFKVIDRQRRWIFLTEYGLEDLHSIVLERAWDTLVDFKKILVQHQITVYKAVATEAFRSASNGVAFLSKVKTELGIDIEVISGSREAELIFKGTSMAVKDMKSINLIMDIGGGSTEFILYKETRMIWSYSFMAGVTYLHNRFVHSDPLSDDDAKQLQQYFETLFREMKLRLRDHAVHALVGASGSFEVLEALAGMYPEEGKCNTVSVPVFMDFYNQFLPTKYEDRLLIDGIPDSRARLIVTAFVLIHYVLDLTPIKVIKISPYALKEGMIRELLNI